MPDSVIEGSVDASEGELLRFAARLRRRHVRGASLEAGQRAALLVALPVIGVMWAFPANRTVVAASFVVVVAIAALRAALRARHTATARLLFVGADPGVQVGVVGDELSTWLDRRADARADASMLAWLRRDVAARLPSVPRRAVARAGRRGLGRVRRLLPFVVLLLLCWLLVEWLQPPWPGLLGGGGSRPLPSGSSSGGGGGAGGEPRRGGEGDRPPETEPPPRRSDERPQEPPPRVPDTGDEPEVKPPVAEAPLLELPDQQRFVVPEFVGDGPTRRARTFAAEIERGGAEAPRTGGGNGGDPDAAPPPSQRETFERAAEAAQRARNVPPEEQPMVRRFFRLLQERAK
ncbi:MAG: hypothetical protein JNK78_18870 [Planctomycetes bacterium]|nr:hypothetical protein [Planctomycetota bacterium]